MRNSGGLNGSQAVNQIVTRSKDPTLEPSRRLSTQPAFYRFRPADCTQNDASSSQLSSDNDDNLDDAPSAGPITRSIFDNNTINNTHNNTQDILNSQSSLIRSRRRTVAGTAAALAGPDPKALLSPFGESHNRRNGNLRRPRTSGSANEKSRKRRSIEKPGRSEPETVKSATAASTRGFQRSKPRASAPSRIPVSVKASAPAPALVQPALPHTPERPQSDNEELVKSGEDSLKKLSIDELGSSPQKSSLRSPTISPPDISPSTRKMKMMEPPSHRRESSDLLEAFFLDSPEQPRLKPLPLEFNPINRGPLKFERQVSHAHVLFGGPAILSPTPDEMPPSSSQTTPGDDDDDEFFNRPSPAKPPPTQFVEPAVVKKFKPRDSGVVVSDESEAGSPIKRPLLPALNLSTSLSGGSIEQDSLTPGTRVARRSSGWPAGLGLAEKSGADQTALKVLFEGASNGNEKDTRPRTPVKRSNAARMFSSAPRSRATLVPPLAAKGKRRNLDCDFG
jgi:hypothetical protein